MASKGELPLQLFHGRRASAFLASCNSRDPFTTFSRATGERSFLHRKVDRSFENGKVDRSFSMKRSIALFDIEGRAEGRK
ncbi:hypothetical protein [Microcoleus sp. S28C3]|uniref:hypothetical protein n=1 Tax=Microcoleus sp. S28C3 TaxID=3055414 RepID=UPI002FD10897